MILKNLTKNTLIATDLKECISLKDKTLGLLDPKNPRCLLFKTRFGVHTFGLAQPIDVLVLNNDLKVIKIKQNLKPNRLFLWNPFYKIVVELAAEFIFKSQTKIGDELKLN